MPLPPVSSLLLSPEQSQRKHASLRGALLRGAVAASVAGNVTAELNQQHHQRQQADALNERVRAIELERTWPVAAAAFRAQPGPFMLPSMFLGPQGMMARSDGIQHADERDTERFTPDDGEAAHINPVLHAIGQDLYKHASINKEAVGILQGAKALVGGVRSGIGAVGQSVAHGIGNTAAQGLQKVVAAPSAGGSALKNFSERVGNTLAGAGNKLEQRAAALSPVKTDMKIPTSHAATVQRSAADTAGAVTKTSPTTSVAKPAPGETNALKTKYEYANPQAGRPGTAAPSWSKANPNAGTWTPPAPASAVAPPPAAAPSHTAAPTNAVAPATSSAAPSTPAPSPTQTASPSPAHTPANPAPVPPANTAVAPPPAAPAGSGGAEAAGPSFIDDAKKWVSDGVNKVKENATMPRMLGAAGVVGGGLLLAKGGRSVMNYMNGEAAPGAYSNGGLGVPMTNNAYGVSQT